jgi:hypothetical protein
MAVGSVGDNDNRIHSNHPVYYISKDYGETWLARNFTIDSVPAKPMAGLNVNLNRRFVAKGGAFDAIVCNNNGEFCTILGHARYIISLMDGKQIYAELPILFTSTDGGINWDRKWPDFSNETGLIPAIETVAIDITGFDN